MDTHSYMILRLARLQRPRRRMRCPPETARADAAARSAGSRHAAGGRGIRQRKNHREAREKHGIRQTVIALNRRGWSPRRCPLTKYRAQLHRRFPIRIYRQRSHIEALFSQFKKTVGSTLYARKPRTRNAELFFRVQAINAMHFKFT